MSQETMTPKDRWEAVLQGNLPDRVPMDYWATPETTTMLIDHFQMEPREIARKLHIDLPFGVWARYIGPELPNDTNVFGIQHRNIDYGHGVYAEATNSPLAEYSSVEEIETNYTWPSADWWIHRM